MFAVVQQIFPVVFGIVWFGGAGILLFRFRAKQFDYLHQSPRIDDKTLGMFVVRNPFGRNMRAVYSAMYRRQDDRELERLRRKMWRSYGAMVLWMFLVPFVTAAALLVLTIVGWIP